MTAAAAAAAAAEAEMEARAMEGGRAFRACSSESSILPPPISLRVRLSLVEKYSSPSSGRDVLMPTQWWPVARLSKCRRCRSTKYE